MTARRDARLALMRAAAGAGVALSLAACVATSDTPAPAAAPVAADASLPRAAAAPPPRPVLAASDIPSLAGLSARDIEARLGPPDFMREDAPAELWQYRSANCVLALYLYPSNGAMWVRHARTWTRARGIGPYDSCSPFAAPEPARG